MKIRSITCFYDPNAENAHQIVTNLSRFIQEFRVGCENIGISAQTCRLSTPSFAALWHDLDHDQLIKKACQLETETLAAGFDYLSLGSALIEYPESFKVIPEMLSETSKTFFSAFIADLQHGVNIASIKAAGSVIFRSALIEPDGFANLRFSALANVEPYGPFFPGSFHIKDQPAALSIAVEAADDVVIAFQSANSLLEAKQDLINRLEAQAVRISAVLENILKHYPIKFIGYDFSVAPYPDDACSLGNALEILGITSLGQHGSLAAAAFLADALDSGNWPRAGFNGLMLPLLEDSILAQRSIDNTLSVKDLLMFSAVCGTGLDTIPLSGDVPQESIEALLLDIAALSSRLQKPLTARLMPVPGKKAGEMTTFNFEFFANSRILALEALPLKRFLGSPEEHFSLQTRNYYRSLR
jgi:hypothetical protein